MRHEARNVFYIHGRIQEYALKGTWCSMPRSVLSRTFHMDSCIMHAVNVMEREEKSTLFYLFVPFKLFGFTPLWETIIQNFPGQFGGGACALCPCRSALLASGSWLRSCSIPGCTFRSKFIKSCRYSKARPNLVWAIDKVVLTIVKFYRNSTGDR